MKKSIFLAISILTIFIVLGCNSSKKAEHGPDDGHNHHANMDMSGLIGNERTDDGKLICPVMGTEFNKEDAYNYSIIGNKAYYYCCAGCKEQIEADPEKYLGKQSQPEQATYLCPMHPKETSTTPAKCNICGMDLVKK